MNTQITENTNSINTLKPQVASVEAKTKNISDEEEPILFAINDVDGNISIQVDESGTTAHKVLTHEVEIRPIGKNAYDVTTRFEAVEATHNSELAKYMTLASFATKDPTNGKVDHAVYADTTNQADNAAKLGGTDASAYAKIADLDFAASVHKHNIEDINGPVTSPQDSTYFIPVSIGSGSAPS